MRALVSLVLVAVAVVVQLTVVDRIAFPGGAGPDLVLLMVAALALAGGPLAGVLTGFWAGLALDVAPPGSHFTGQNALVFCLVGYCCGLLADDTSRDGVTEQGHTALFEIVVTAAGAVCGEALAALLGVMLSDPRVTWPAITRVLPAAVAYDVLLCPFVLYAAAAVLRLAGAGAGRRRSGWSPAPARTQMRGAGPGAVRQLSGGSVPRLRMAESGNGQARALRGAGTGPPARREPQLRLAGSGSRTSKSLLARAGTANPVTGTLGAAFATGRLAGGPAKLRLAGRRHPGVLGGSLLGAGRPARFPMAGSGLAGAGLAGSGRAGAGRPGARFSRSTMGRSLLGGSVFSRPPSPFGRPLTGVASGRVPRLARDGALSRLGGGLRRPGRPKSLGRGWLRRTPRSVTGGAKRRTPRTPVLGRRAFRASAFGGGRGIGRGARLRMPKPKTPRRRSWRRGGHR